MLGYNGQFNNLEVREGGREGGEGGREAGREGGRQGGREGGGVKECK